MATKAVEAFKTKLCEIERRVNQFSDWLNNCKDLEMELDTVELIDRLKNIEAGYSSFIGIDPPLQHELENELKNLDDAYFASVGLAKRLLKKHMISEENVSTISNLSNLNQTIRLPKITLPTFDGALEEWLTFHDTFNSLVHANEAMSDIQKFHYLKSSLSGKAAQTIHSIPLTSNNYCVAWNMLKKRYENKKLIIDSHLSSIFNLRSVTDQASSLRFLIDQFNKHVRALEVFKEPTKDTLLLYLAVSKLDIISREKWEEFRVEIDSPTFDDLITFVQTRCQILESTPTNKYVARIDKPGARFNATTMHSSVQSTDPIRCPKCKQQHTIFKCPEFVQMSPQLRYQEVKRLRLCTNCLDKSHQIKFCTSGNCRKCNSRHHTMLHFANIDNVSIISSNGGEQESSTSNTVCTATTENSEYVFLTTAVVDIIDSAGNKYPCRTLLDSGSQSNFISERFVNCINTFVQNINTPVSGIGQLQTVIKHQVQVSLKSRFNAFRKNIKCLVIKQIADNLPPSTIDVSTLKIPKYIKLTDPNFNKSSPIDVLLGASVFWELMCEGKIDTKNGPSLHKTHLGWVLAGGMSMSQRTTNPVSCNVSININTDALLRRFWEIEEIQGPPAVSPEQRRCELHFVNNCQVKEGKFIVKLPTKENVHNLGDNYFSALKQFQALERRFINNPQLKTDYQRFMSEYDELGHMTATQPGPGYYLPNHGILKTSSSTTKLRIVFNGSAKASNGISLNDTLLIGPTIQDELFNVLLRFRTHKFALIADIEKMYRQIWVHTDNRHLQKILWRSDPTEPVKAYTLNTVTYGTASAPFLAIRCLQEACRREVQQFPIASAIGLRDFYVDDLLTGADTVEDVTTLKQDLSKMLEQYGFHLRKWRSNCSEISSQGDLVDISAVGSDEFERTVKTLGVKWDTISDVFVYKPSGLTITTVTKRTILSTISKIYDPLGLLSPVITRAKLLVQRLWQLKIDWDEPLPQDLQQTWATYERQLNSININIQRYVFHSQSSITLHGFSDASEAAYGACVYVKSTSNDGYVHTRLLCGKSRVAPVKKITLPRLELCGALLLAHLIEKVKTALEIPTLNIYLWTDSTIVLAWLKSSPQLYKTFVANRISQIQSLTENCIWNHVPSEDNPADLLSRGTSSEQLQRSLLWWNGPNTLSEGRSFLDPTSDWEGLPERKSTLIAAVAAISNIFIDFSRHSSLIKLRNTIGYCLRFINNLRKPKDQRCYGPITAEEIKQALTVLVKLVQQQHFYDEILCLLKGLSVKNNSSILSLHPILDADGILRVGGRLKEASLPYNQRYPAILPSKHRFTQLVINYEHLRHLHGGP